MTTHVDAGVHRAPAPAAKYKIVLGEFENRTGDPVFDGILRAGLVRATGAVPVPDSRLGSTGPAGAAFHEPAARDAAHSRGGAGDLRASRRHGGPGRLDCQPRKPVHVLWLRARNCRTGDILGQEQAQAGEKEEVLNALTRIAVQIRARLGESLSAIREHSTPLEQATTSSLEALKAYSAARKALFARGSAAAIPDLQRAIAIDPQFAMAQADLGFFYWNMGQTDLGAEYVRKAYELRDRVSDRERLFILFLYDRQVTGNLQKELETLESWAQTYPGDFLPWGLLGGWGTRGTGQYERGIQASEQALRIRSGRSPPLYGNLVELNLCLGRFAEAAAALQRAAERKLELPLFLVNRYYLAFLMGDEAGMKREIDRARGNLEAERLDVAQPGPRPGAFRTDAKRENPVAAYHRTGATGRRSREGRHLSGRGGGVRSTSRKSEIGRKRAPGGSRTRERAAMWNMPRRVALALSGDCRGSQTLAEDLAKRFPEDTPVQFEYLPTLRALSALARKAPLDAIERLQTALPYDLAMPGTLFFAKFGGLYPAYVRGLAYLEAGRGREAAAEFQKVLDHRGIVLADPIGAIGALAIGESARAIWRSAGSRTAYEDFLALWKDADADLPILAQARAEHAVLIANR